jgi:hypothetical protein
MATRVEERRRTTREAVRPMMGALLEKFSPSVSSKLWRRRCRSCGILDVLEVYALRLSRDLAYIVGVAPINSTLCNTFHQDVDPMSPCLAVR